MRGSTHQTVIGLTLLPINIKEAVGELVLCYLELSCYKLKAGQDAGIDLVIAYGGLENLEGRLVDGNVTVCLLKASCGFLGCMPC